MEGLWGGPEESGAGRLAPGRTGRARPPDPRTFWDQEDQEDPSSQHGPSSQALLSCLFEEPKGFCSKTGAGLFLALVGESECLPSVQKYMVYEPGRQELHSSKPRRRGSRPSAAGLPPSAAPSPTCPRRAVTVCRLPVPRPSLGPSRTGSQLKLRAAVTGASGPARALLPVRLGKEDQPAVGGGQEAPCPLATPHSLTPHMFLGPLSRARPTGARTQGRLAGAFPVPLAFTVWRRTDVRPGVRIRALHSWGPTRSGCL